MKCGFPWCLSGKETACQGRRREFNPWSQKIPQAVEQLSPRAAASEPEPSAAADTCVPRAQAPPETPAREEPGSPAEKRLCGTEDPAQPETEKQRGRRTDAVSSRLGIPEEKVRLLQSNVSEGALVTSNSANPRPVTHQAPLCMRFSRQECSSRLSFPGPGDPPNPGTKPESPASPATARGFFPTLPPGKPIAEQGSPKICSSVKGRRAL